MKPSVCGQQADGLLGVGAYPDADAAYRSRPICWNCRFMYSLHACAENSSSLGVPVAMACRKSPWRGRLLHTWYRSRRGIRGEIVLRRPGNRSVRSRAVPEGRTFYAGTASFPYGSQACHTGKLFVGKPSPVLPSRQVDALRRGDWKIT